MNYTNIKILYTPTLIASIYLSSTLYQAKKKDIVNVAV